MKEFLLVLFYQAIVAVNTAVILSAIVWLAKRKDEKDGRKPNPDFTPPPEKKPEVELRSALIKTVNGEKIAQRWYSPDEQIPRYAILQGEPYKFFAEIDKDGGKLVEFARIKPPTTGSAAIKPKCGISADEAAKLVSKLAEAPACLGDNSELDELEYEPPMHIPTEGAKEHKCDKYSCLYSPFCNLTREQVLDGLDRYIKAFSPNDLLDRVENEMKRIKDDQRTGTQPIQSFIGEVRGGPGNEVMGTVAAKSAEELEEKLKALSDRLDRIEKKPVTPERLKEAGFEAEYLNAKCGECKNWKRDNQIFGHCALRRCPVKEYERRQCQFFEKWEAPAKTTHICRNCKHYLATDEDAATGLCGMKDEITFPYSCHACFEKREGE